MIFFQDSLNCTNALSPFMLSVAVLDHNKAWKYDFYQIISLKLPMQQWQVESLSIIPLGGSRWPAFQEDLSVS